MCTKQGEDPDPCSRRNELWGFLSRPLFSLHHDHLDLPFLHCTCGRGTDPMGESGGVTHVPTDSYLRGTRATKMVNPKVHMSIDGIARICLGKGNGLA